MQCYNILIYLKLSTMSASQDKVQAILETLLQESLPLVNKGIFTSQQLQEAMCEREKLENNMLKPTFQMSDYLKAIQFEYSLERDRRNRVQQLSFSNPLFKKQGKTDFVIIKRIIRLWDRTMHKFKYNVSLWKQYLQFCIKTQSKNQFYKALSKALRFLPISEDLWLIGVHYEIQVGLNMWKARKIYIKALKMNPKNVNLWMSMFKFQIEFLCTIYQRQKAILGQSSFDLIINEPKQQSEQLQIQQEQGDNQEKQKNSKYIQMNLQEHDDILFLVFEEAYNKVQQNNKKSIKMEMIQLLKKRYSAEKDKKIIKILKSAQNKIKKYGDQVESKPKLQQNKQIVHRDINKSSIEEKQQYYQAYLTENKGLGIKQLDKIISQFVMKPVLLTALLSSFLEQDIQNSIHYIFNSQAIKPHHLPPQLLKLLLQKLQFLLNVGKRQIENKNSQQQNKYSKNLANLLQKISSNKMIEHLPLLQQVIKLNKRLGNFKANNNIYRSLSILCKKQPEIVERCNHWIHDKSSNE